MTGAKVFRLSITTVFVKGNPGSPLFQGQGWCFICSKPGPCLHLTTAQKRWKAGITSRTPYHDVYLVSPQQGTPWNGPRMAARQGRSVVEPGAHGIHAYRNLRAAVSAGKDFAQQWDHPQENAAYAILRPEGQTVIGEYGWVAEAATIVRIYLMPSDYLEHARQLYDRYRAPVQLLPSRLREPVQRCVDTPTLDIFNLRYGPESGASLWRTPRGKLSLHVPRRLHKPANLVLWDPVIAALGELGRPHVLTARERGRLGGLARGKALQRKEVPCSGAARPLPTMCLRCCELLQSAREAWRHCRTGKPGRPNKRDIA